MLVSDIEKYRKTDDILDLWKSTRRSIINNIRNKDELNNILYHDCLTCSNLPSLIKNNYKCINCIGLNILIDFETFKKEEEIIFEIESGREKGNFLDLIKKDIIFIDNIRLSNNTIGLPQFLNDIVINCYLNGRDNIRKLYLFTNCLHKSINIYQHINIGNITNLSNTQKYSDNNVTAQLRTPSLKINVVKDIFTQLVSSLRNLEKDKFFHGSPHIKNIVFDNQKGLILKIINFRNSSIQIPGKNNMKYIYSFNPISDIQLNHTPYIYKKDDSFSFGLIAGNYSHFIQWLRHSNSLKKLKYISSLNLVCFIFSLMSFKPFYTPFKKTKYYEDFKSTWLKEDFEDIESNIKHLHQKDELLTSTSKIMLLLSNKWIKFDILNQISI